MKLIKNKRILCLAFSLMLIVPLFANSSLAWVSSNAREITNKFVLGSIGASVVEKFDGNIKSNVAVKNSGNTADYVRVNLVVQVLDEQGNIVATPNDDISFENCFNIKGFNSENWLKIGEFYYYKKSLPAGEKSEVLFSKVTPKIKFNNTSLNLIVMSQGIQKSGISSWTDVSLDTNGNIIGGMK